MGSTIKAAVIAAMDDWKSGGQLNVDRMREMIDSLVEDAVCDWQTMNVDATTDEEEAGE